MFKRPALHHGKQRLAADIGPEQTLTIAGKLLACALEDAAGWPGPVALAPASTDDADWAEDLLNGTTVVPQGSGNLGERLNHVDETLRAEGHRQLIFIGSDAPGLTQQQLQGVTDQLEEYDCVFGMADDGGVTFMANRKPWPDLTALPWSSPELGADLRALCEQQQLITKTTDGGFDVDDQSDLNRLLTGLASDARPARRQLRQTIKDLTS